MRRIPPRFGLPGSALRTTRRVPRRRQDLAAPADRVIQHAAPVLTERISDLRRRDTVRVLQDHIPPAGKLRSGAASLSLHRHQRHTPHRRSGQNRCLDHRSSDKIATEIVILPPNTPASASPTQAAAPSNPHNRQPPNPAARGSFLEGFRTPALSARAGSYNGPASESLHQSGPSLCRGSIRPFLN